MEKVTTVTGDISVYSLDEWIERNRWAEEDCEHECPDCVTVLSCGFCVGTGVDERSYTYQRKRDLKNWGEWHTKSKVSTDVCKRTG